MMKQINPISLKNKINNKEDFQLIDIREDYEFEICCIGGDKISMYSIPDSIDKISKSKEVIIYCRTGSRSATIVKMLEDNYSFDNVYNLDGGIMRWREDVDKTLKEY
tara:strand:+ start:294 stop:614 length:321 start_codon:yes stop_codon:yes gene_type:complete